MSFNSFDFFVFFPFVTILYFVFPSRYRRKWLLLASCYFYAAFIPHYLLILWLVIINDYISALLIDHFSPRKKLAKLFLIISISANVGLLCVFKYFNFFADNIAFFLKTMQLNFNSPHLELILPIGLSFHTFQSMSYVIEVFRKKQKVEKNLGIFALYVLFYPQLVAGPIERPTNMLPQIRKDHDFDHSRLSGGFRLMLWGFFKKVVIADNLAKTVNLVYDAPQSQMGPVLLLATLLFSFQIYCDFSGYTDIARGAARIMGFDLMINFKRPYFSRSVGDFWSRWHISLSTWFRDYLYIPLGGNRAGFLKKHRNLFITFAISGLWHGANWTFLAWGVLNWLYLLVSDITSSIRRRLCNYLGLPTFPGLHDGIKITITFSIIAISWVFFRANSLTDAFYIISHLGSGWNQLFADIRGIADLRAFLYDLGCSKFTLACLLILIFSELLEEHNMIDAIINKSPVIRWSAYYALVLLILFFGDWGQSRFIYFQF